MADDDAQTMYHRFDGDCDADALEDEHESKYWKLTRLQRGVGNGVFNMFAWGSTYGSAQMWYTWATVDVTNIDDLVARHYDNFVTASADGTLGDLVPAAALGSAWLFCLQFNALLFVFVYGFLKLQIFVGKRAQRAGLPEKQAVTVFVAKLTDTFADGVSFFSGLLLYTLVLSTFVSGSDHALFPRLLLVALGLTALCVGWNVLFEDVFATAAGSFCTSAKASLSAEQQWSGVGRRARRTATMVNEWWVGQWQWLIGFIWWTLALLLLSADYLDVYAHNTAWFLLILALIGVYLSGAHLKAYCLCCCGLPLPPAWRRAGGQPPQCEGEGGMQASTRSTAAAELGGAGDGSEGEGEAGGSSEAQRFADRIPQHRTRNKKMLVRSAVWVTGIGLYFFQKRLNPFFKSSLNNLGGDGAGGDVDIGALGAYCWPLIACCTAALVAVELLLLDHDDLAHLLESHGAMDADTALHAHGRLACALRALACAPCRSTAAPGQGDGAGLLRRGLQFFKVVETMLRLSLCYATGKALQALYFGYGGAQAAVGDGHLALLAAYGQAIASACAIVQVRGLVAVDKVEVEVSHFYRANPFPPSATLPPPRRRLHGRSRRSCRTPQATGGSARARRASLSFSRTKETGTQMRTRRRLGLGQGAGRGSPPSTRSSEFALQ
jgi:hypothetical protein